MPALKIALCTPNAIRLDSPPDQSLLRSSPFVSLDREKANREVKERGWTVGNLTLELKRVSRPEDVPSGAGPVFNFSFDDIDQLDTLVLVELSLIHI